MLSARAYSFRQKSRLAISLSWIGGYTNTVAFLACASLVSHHSGNSTRFAELLVKEPGSWETWHFGFLVLLFFMGAVASAFMTEGAERRGWRSKYILPMLAEAVLIALFAVGLVRQSHPVPLGPTVPLFALSGMAAFAMGLQNATITKISGAVIRTTHLTGVVTDLGLESVQLWLWYRDKLRGRRWARMGRVWRVSQRHPTFLRVLLLGSIYGSFLFGVLAGTYVYLHWPDYALIMPVAFLLWIVFVDYHQPIADVRELDLLSDPELKGQGIVKTLLPAELGIYRLLCHRNSTHRAPNFQQWADRLPGHWRVIIMALSPLTHLDDNAMMDLQEAVMRLRISHRRLILCGMTTKQYKKMDALGIIQTLDAENVTPDLEFAIARGIALLQEIHGQHDEDPVMVA
jgi:uncharacterized membrane protein YoaK (UPF0700 family)